jgi:hypothetical protein
VTQRCGHPCSTEEGRERLKACYAKGQACSQIVDRKRAEPFRVLRDAETFPADVTSRLRDASDGCIVDSHFPLRTNTRRKAVGTKKEI